MGISAFPDIPASASPILESLRQSQAAKAVKIPVGTVSTTDLTIKSEIDVNNSLVQIAEEFDDFNVSELAYVARNININSNNAKYSPIPTMVSVNQKYDPKKIIALQGALSYLNAFDYDIKNYLPEEGNGTGGSYAYLSGTDILIDLVNINYEKVEVEFLTFEDVFDDTIYT